MIKHDFVSELQPTNVSCTQTATAMLLSHYDTKYNVASILQQAPTEDFGSSMQQLATYCIDQGYDVEMYSFDARILDFTWSGLPDNELIEKLESVKIIRNVESLGSELTRQYIEEYIEFIRKGGKLIIQPFPTRDLLTRLVTEGPVCVAVNFTTLLGTGHSKNIGLRASEHDEFDNDVTTHAVLVYGQDDDGNFLFSDPWGNPQLNSATSDQLIASVMAAQWLCDDIIFRIKPTSNPA